MPLFVVFRFLIADREQQDTLGERGDHTVLASSIRPPADIRYAGYLCDLWIPQLLKPLQKNYFSLFACWYICIHVQQGLYYVLFNYYCSFYQEEEKKIKKYSEDLFFLLSLDIPVQQSKLDNALASEHIYIRRLCFIAAPLSTAVAQQGHMLCVFVQLDPEWH